jgi:hypothetical protein
MKRLVLILAIVGVLTLPAAAIAQSSQNGYSNVAGVSAGGNNAGGNAPTAVQTTSGGGGGNLPFTGLELGLVAGGGALLLGAGFALRRVARHNH